ncbi:MAG: mitochondrial fission ELM1 family protein [Proteobacteria bacterium]|nr:mitochondrial fission ELM1 family protein [Pseudomonadota bacterium]
MEKFNKIWIFSDSIAGHEIQSKALASKLSDCVTLFHCTIRQPWLSFAPRILPRFGKNIIWEKQQPGTSQQPDVIITCGRRMAAVGKYYKRQLNCKHIQILNPGGNPGKYDVLICPEHDKIEGKNIIKTQGSLHSISLKSLKTVKCHSPTSNKTISILLGNPSDGFFNNLNILREKIQLYFPNHQIMLCASRRTPSKHYSSIKTAFSKAKLIWLNEEDGENPYFQLLACSDIIIVTADSINMLSEVCATEVPVIVIGKNDVSPKHKRFIDSMEYRLSTFENLKPINQPLNTLEVLVQEIKQRL